MDSKTKNYIERVRQVHGDKYDYRKTVYTKAREKVIVTCHNKDEFGDEHGDFYIRACNHLLGTGCPKCGNRFSYTLDGWIRKANKIHNNKYDYTLIADTHGKSKGKIICPIHGVFEQELSSHLSGCGCPKCNKGVVDTRDGFIASANKIHHNYYDYNKVIYVNRKSPVTIICPRHGEFTQTPDAHLRGCGCKKCKSSVLESIVLKALNDNNIQYIFQYTFGKTRQYKADFFIPQTNTIIECQGEQHFFPTKFSTRTSDETARQQLFDRMAYDKDKYNTAIEYGYNVVYFTIPKYFNNDIDISSFDFYRDKQLYTHVFDLTGYLKSLLPTVEARNSFTNFYYDFRHDISDNTILIGETAFKYNNFVVAYHKLSKNEKDTLNEMTRRFKKRGYRTIHVFEDEYVNHRDIVLSKLSHILKLNKNKPNKVYGRKCTIDEIDVTLSKSFLDKNHIQGFSSSTIYLGAFFNNLLIGVMTFLRDGEDEWTLTRFATDNGFNCCGVGGKLFKYFIRKYSPLKVKSFADKRWTVLDDNIYTKIGFVQESSSYPDYHYIRYGETVRYHKFGFRKQILHKKYGLPLTMTEKEMTKQLGYDRIWDCGLIRYVYKNPEYNK